jgi:hypothetical protein
VTEPWPAPAEAANTAAESVRALNHATLSGTGYEWPSDVGAVMNALTTLAQRLPQALDQAGRWLEREHNAGRVGHDHGDALTFDAVDQALTHRPRAHRRARLPPHRAPLVTARPRALASPTPRVPFPDKES